MAIIICYNCTFIIEKGPFVEWMAANGGELNLYLWKQRRLQVLISKQPLISAAAAEKGPGSKASRLQLH